MAACRSPASASQTRPAWSGSKPAAVPTPADGASSRQIEPYLRCPIRPPTTSPTTTGIGESANSATSARRPGQSLPRRHRTPSDNDLDQILADLGYHTRYLIEDGHAWTHGPGEQRRYAIQHALKFQIWELDQPHLIHAHGPTPQQRTNPDPIAPTRRTARQHQQQPARPTTSHIARRLKIPDTSLRSGSWTGCPATRARSGRNAWEGPRPHHGRRRQSQRRRHG
jgi:hypothetical protein